MTLQTNPSLCYCRNDRLGHERKPQPYWGKPDEKGAQVMLSACPAQGREGVVIGKISLVKYAKAVRRAKL